MFTYQNVTKINNDTFIKTSKGQITLDYRIYHEFKERIIDIAPRVTV